MYKIENRPSGYILTFAGNIDIVEMQKWYDESKQALQDEVRKDFGVVINMKDLMPIPADAQGIMIQGQKLFKEKGMLRSSVILVNSNVCLQFKNLALQSGIYATERYIDASRNPNPIETAIAWVKDSIDPDKK